MPVLDRRDVYLNSKDQWSELSRNKNFQACTQSWSLRRIPAYLRTRSINSSYDKASFLLPRLHPLFSSLFLDVHDSAFSSGINQDKCLGNIVGQCLAGTGNGSLWSDTDMYFIWLGEFFFIVLTLITVSDIRSMAFTHVDYKISKSRSQSRHTITHINLP